MRVLQVINKPVRIATGGGDSRTQALDQFIDSIGGARVVVQNEAWQKSRIYRQTRPLSLLGQIRRARPEALVVRYPGFPFFWRHDRNLELARAHAFLRLLRRLTRRIGCRAIVDILDLLRYPSPNPDLALRLSDRALAAFERCLLQWADQVWACSHSIRSHLIDTYDLDQEKVAVVLNGGFRHGNPEPPPTIPRPCAPTFSFFYAGDLAPGWRGTEIMLDGFTRHVSDPAARLVVCGVNGAWIEQAYPDRRITNLGTLSAEQVAAAGRGCHVGLVPQPESGYYHLAFPTKVGLYLTLGLPVLTTRAREAAEFVETHGVGVAAQATRFGEAMRDLAADPGRLEPMRLRSASVGEGFYWDAIYRRAFDMFASRFADGEVTRCAA